MNRSDRLQLRLVIDWVMFEEWIKQPKNLLGVIVALLYVFAILLLIAFGSSAFAEGRDTQDYYLMMIGLNRILIALIMLLGGWTYCEIDTLQTKIRRLEESL